METNKEINSYCGIIYDEMVKSEVGMSPRGEWYHFVLIKNNRIIAYGEEQGNYAGGVLGDCKSCGKTLKNWFNNLSLTKDEYDKSLYEKIKHYKIGKSRDCKKTIRDTICYSCQKPNGNEYRIIRRLVGDCLPYHYFIQEITENGTAIKIKAISDKELRSGKLEVYPGRTVIVVPGV
jgi:hypothetical protein